MWLVWTFLSSFNASRCLSSSTILISIPSTFAWYFWINPVILPISSKGDARAVEERWLEFRSESIVVRWIGKSTRAKSKMVRRQKAFKGTLRRLGHVFFPAPAGTAQVSHQLSEVNPRNYEHLNQMCVEGKLISASSSQTNYVFYPSMAPVLPALPSRQPSTDRSQ